MVKRVGALLAVALLAVFVLAACGSEDDEGPEPTVTRIPDEEVANLPVAGATPPSAAPGGDQAPPAAAGPPVALDVEMVDIAFTQTELTVPAGAAVTVNLVNAGASAHNFTIEELGVSSGDYAAGQTGTVEFTAPSEPGTYEYVCTIPGHREAGMVGTLIVTAAGAAGGEEAGGEASPMAAATPPAATPAVEPSPMASPVPDDADQAAGPVTLDVEMVDIAFAQTELTVPAGAEVTVNLVNSGATSHNFSIPSLDVHSGDYAPGQTGTLTFTAPAEPGEHEYVCDIPGHKEAGMVGTLIVSGGAPAPASDATTPTAGGTPPTPADARAPVAAGPVTLDVEMVDIAFAPTELTVPAAAEVTVNLVNSGAAAHNFTIEELGVASGDYVSGQTGTVTFTAPSEPGEYEFVCTIPGHREAGMVGTLIVTAAGAPAGGGPGASPVAGASPVGSPPAGPPPGGPVAIDLGMVDIAFEETELTVPANTEITIRLANNGAAAHNFNIDELSVQSGDYAASQTGEVTFNTGAPGEYEYYCSIPGHREAGMVGKLIVQ